MKIYELSTIFGTKTKAQEILYLLFNLKSVVRQGFYDIEFNKIAEFCEKNNIFFCKSHLKVVFLDNIQKYSNLGVMVDGNDKRDGMFFYYFSKKKELSYLARQYEENSDIKSFGEILGYPSCCIDYFIKNFSKETPNPEIKSNNLFTNISKREKDLVIISHFPCSINCEKTVELGKKYFEIIKQNDINRAKELLNGLQ